MKEGNHPIFVALKARDLGRAFELSKEDKSWAEVVVCDGPLRGQSVLHLVAGQQPKTARRGHEPWYAEWCDYLVREVCDVPQGSGCLWVRRGGGEGEGQGADSLRLHVLSRPPVMWYSKHPTDNRYLVEHRKPQGRWLAGAAELARPNGLASCLRPRQRGDGQGPRRPRGRCPVARSRQATTTTTTGTTRTRTTNTTTTTTTMTTRAISKTTGRQGDRATTTTTTTTTRARLTTTTATTGASGYVPRERQYGGHVPRERQYGGHVPLQRRIARDKSVGERDVRKQPEREREKDERREGGRAREIDRGIERDRERDRERGTDFLMGRPL